MRRNVPVPDIVARPGLFSVRPRSFRPAPERVRPPFAFAVPVPKIDPPVQVRLPETLKLLEPVRTPFVMLNVGWLTDPSVLLRFSVPPVSWIVPMLARVPVKFATPPETRVVPVMLYPPGKFTVPLLMVTFVPVSVFEAERVCV